MEKQNKKICIGITEGNELVFIKIEIGSCDNNHFTITHRTYDGIIDEETGEQEARERLEDSSYWNEIGYLKEDCFLNQFIDFKEVAEHVINNDGWENVNGEHEYIGEYEKKSYYVSYSSCGASIDDLKKDFKKLLITEEEKQILIKSDELHLKDFKQYTKEEKEFFKNKVLPLFKKEDESLTSAEHLISVLIE